MGLNQLIRQYGGGGHVAINRAIRAECPGGADLLDAVELANNLRKPDVMPEAVMQKLRSVRDRMAEHVLRPEPAQKETRPMSSASEESFESTPSRATEDSVPKIASIHAAPAANQTPEISLAALRPSSLGSPQDNRNWTPPAALVAQFGVLSIAELSRISGVDTRTIREAHDRLNIEPLNVSLGQHVWTDKMDAMLGTKSDPELGALWNRSATTVKARREVLKVAAYSDDHDWTPDMDRLIEARTHSDAELGKRFGRSGEAVRRRREKLGIAPTRAKLNWRDPRIVDVMREQADNVTAAQMISAIVGRPVTENAIKIARSRAKKDSDAPRR